MEALNVLLLIFVLVSAVSVSLVKDLLSAIVIFMVQSSAMAVIWILLRAPDLAITEAAVGAGITTLLMFVTLKKLHAIHIEEPHGEDEALRQDAREAGRTRGGESDDEN